MAGPCLGVHASFDGPPPSWRELLSPFADHWYDPESCLVADRRQSGDDANEHLRPFVGSVGLFGADPHESPEDDAAAAAIEACCGRAFSHTVIVAAMSNRPRDHRLLAETAIGLAERIDGWIDFDILDTPPETGLLRCEWSSNGERGFATLGTPHAARVWLTHPRFHLIK